jgi:hypothetical protein
MKKTILRSLFVILLVIVALLVLFIVVNRFDDTLTDIYSEKDIPAASLEKDNGFYLLWAYGEAPDVDITSDKIIAKYRKLFDTSTNYKAVVKNWDHNPYKNMYTTHFRSKYKKTGINDSLKKDISQKDWCQAILSNKANILPLDPDLQVLYDRFQMMIDSPKFEDFTTLEALAPLPNLLAWLHGAKLYTGVNMLRAIEGNWETGVSRLLDQVDFAKRAVKGSRFLIVNLVSKAIMHFPLQGIANLMNRKDCPESVYRLILDRMPPLKFEEYGTSNTLKCEVIAFSFNYVDDPLSFDEGHFSLFEKLAVKLLLQKNKTKNYCDTFFKKYIEMEATPPYKWVSDKIDVKPLEFGPFWWLSNAGGKLLLENYGADRGKYAVIYKTYHRKASYDLVRISAELHLKYDPEKPVQETLNSLDSYKTIDLCSGKPYKWNDEKQILYSVGTDRADNKGETLAYTQIEGTDYAIPIVLFLK